MLVSVVARFVATGAFVLFGALLDAEPALGQPDLPPPPSFAPDPKAPVTHVACPVILGPRVGGFGPNSAATVAFGVQPGLCWLELSVGLGFGLGEISASGGSIDPHDPVGLQSDARYVSFTVPLGVRFWFMEKHSLLGDAGFGFTRYLMSGDIATEYGDTWDGRLGKWDRPTTALVTYFGAGYGYRFLGAQAGARVAAVVGAFVHLTEFKDSTMLLGPATDSSEVEGLKDAMDRASDELAELEPYGELSVSFMF
jgi:hypothetical protein